MRGGYRKNSGRKKGFAAKGAEEAHRVFSEQVAKEIIPLSQILIAKAKKGDIRAIKELFDRAWGRPPQALEIEQEVLYTPGMSLQHLSNAELEAMIARAK
jgi:hypothetical protein